MAVIEWDGTTLTLHHRDAPVPPPIVLLGAQPVITQVSCGSARSHECPAKQATMDVERQRFAQQVLRSLLEVLQQRRPSAQLSGWSDAASVAEIGRCADLVDWSATRLVSVRTGGTVPGVVEVYGRLEHPQRAATSSPALPIRSLAVVLEVRRTRQGLRCRGLRILIPGSHLQAC